MNSVSSLQNHVAVTSKTVSQTLVTIIRTQSATYWSVFKVQGLLVRLVTGLQNAYWSQCKDGQMPSLMCCRRLLYLLRCILNAHCDHIITGSFHDCRLVNHQRSPNFLQKIIL
jgi:hypothetical protein